MGNNIALTIVTLICTCVLAEYVLASDVNVKGYYRKDGTYVRPHVRSSPDSYKWNNYGPSKSTTELMNPRLRDADKDGTPNYLDTDDNNNGIVDDLDPSQYNRSSKEYVPQTPKHQASKATLENLRTCLNGNYSSLCKHSMLSPNELAQANEAERQVNLRTCLNGNYSSLCKHSMLTEKELKAAKEAEAR